VSSHDLESAQEIADWLRLHLISSHRLSYPYARKWEIGGCSAKHWLWSWPSDRLSDLAAGLVSCNYPVAAVEDGVVIRLSDKSVKLCVNRSSPGPGLPDAYAFIDVGSDLPGYVGNSPEVIVELLRGYPSPAPPLVESDLIEVGFPGREHAELTYVGSWQWDVHGEARETDFVRRAVAATLAAIDARKAQQ
jgi:hypothetical protein